MHSVKTLKLVSILFIAFVQLSISGTSCFKHKRDSKVASSMVFLWKNDLNTIRVLKRLARFYLVSRHRSEASQLASRERERERFILHIYIYVHRRMDQSVPAKNDKYVKRGRTDVWQSVTRTHFTLIGENQWRDTDYVVHAYVSGCIAFLRQRRSSSQTGSRRNKALADT